MTTPFALPFSSSLASSTVGTLLEAMRNKPTFVQMIEYTLKCLQNLMTQQSDIRSVMIDEGVIESLKLVLKLNPYNERVQRLVNEMLRALASTDESAKQMGARLSGEPLVFSLRKHVQPDTLISTCQAASELMRTPDNVHMLVESGIIPALSQVYKTQEEHSEVLQAANECLVSLTSQVSSHSILIDSDLHSQVLTSVEHFANKPKLITSGLAALNALAKTQYSAVSTLPNLLDVVIAATASNPEERELLNESAQCLQRLSGDEEIKSILSINNENITLALSAAATKLSSLLLADSNIHFATQHKGVEWISETLNTAINCDDAKSCVLKQQVVAAACRSLERLSINEYHIYASLKQGCGKLLVSAIERCGHNEDIAIAGMSALTSLLTREENGFYLAKCGALKAAHSVQAQHPLSERVQCSLLAFENTMSSYSKCAAVQLQQGSVKTMIDIIESRSKKDASSANPKVLCRALASLNKLINQAETADHIHADEVCATTLAALQTSSQDCDVVKNSLNLLSSLGIKCPEIFDAKVHQAAQISLQSHPQNSSLCDMAAPLLFNPSGVNLLQPTTCAHAATVEHMDQAIEQMSRRSSSCLIRLKSASEMIAVAAGIPNQVQNLLEAGTVRRLAAAFETAGKFSATGETINARAGVLTSNCKALRSLYEHAGSTNASVARELASGGTMRNMARVVLQENNESLTSDFVSLVALLVSDPQSAKTMMQDGAIMDTLNAVSLHPYNSQLASSAIKMIGQLGASKENASQLVQLGSVPILLNSVINHSNDSLQVQNKLQILDTLTSTADKAHFHIPMDNIEGLLNILHVYRANADIVRLACRCLSHLVTNSESAMEVGEHNGCHILVQVIRDHWKDENLCEITMSLLDSLASFPCSIQALLDPDLTVVELVRFVLQQYPQNRILVETCEHILQQLLVSSTPSNDSERMDLQTMQSLLSDLKADVNVMDSLKKLHGAMHLPANADLMLRSHGLEHLSSLLLTCANNTPIFTIAAQTFTKVVEHGDSKLVEEHVQVRDCIKTLVILTNTICVAAKPLSMDDATAIVNAIRKVNVDNQSVSIILQHNVAPLLMSFACSYNKESTQLQAASARLLAKLSNHDQGNSGIARITNIRELIQALRNAAQERGHEAEDFLKYGTYLLGSLAANDAKIREEIGLEGGIQVIVFICNIPQLRMKSAFIEYTTLALVNLSLNSANNQAFIVASKGIETLLELIQLHTGGCASKGVSISSDGKKKKLKQSQIDAERTTASELIDNAVCVLCNVCEKNDSYKQLILDLQGALIIVSSMLAHFDGLQLQMDCFRVLMNLAFNSSSINSLIQAGTITSVVAATSVHAQEEQLIILSLRLLANLSSVYHEATMQIMCEQGAVQAVLETAHQRGQDGCMDLLLAAYSCLCNLARFVPNAQLMISQHAGDAIKTSINSHAHDAEQLILVITRLFQTLSRVPHSDRDKLVASGMSDPCTKILRGYAESFPIFNCICSSIANLAHNRSQAKAFSACVSVLLFTPKFSQHEPKWLCSAFNALAALTRDESNSIQMGDACLQHLSTLLIPNDANKMNLKLLHASLALLADLAVWKAAITNVVTTPLASSLMTLMHQHVNQPDTLRLALQALENMCYAGTQVKRYLGESKIEQEVEMVMVNNSQHDDVRQACQAVLDAFRRTDAPSDCKWQGKPFEDLQVKSARSLFGDEQKSNDISFPDDLRNFLVAGALLMKHSRTAPPRHRHVYLTSDLKWLIWRDVSKPVDAETQMKTWKIKSCSPGRVSEQLQRKRFGRYLAKEECAFSIQCRERTIDLECNNEQERDHWCRALDALIFHLKRMKVDHIDDV